MFIVFVSLRLKNDGLQCLCGASNCRGWLGKTPQEFHLENSVALKKNFALSANPASNPKGRAKDSLVRAAVQKSDKSSIKATPAPCLATGRKRSLDVDEFGLSATQRRLQTQAMAKLEEQKSKIIQNNDGISTQAPILVVAGKRARDVDEFGLTAAQRQIQMQAFAKLKLQTPQRGI